MPFVWLGIAVVLALVEASAPALVCIWFCIGAVAALITSIFVKSVLIQIIVFLAVSLIALIALRPLMRKRINVSPEDARTNSDSYIGRDVVVTTAIPAGTTGRAKLADISWVAKTRDGSALPAGARGRVCAVDGTTLIIEPTQT